MEGADDVDLRLACLCAGLNDVQQRPFFSAGEVKATLFQDRAELLLFLDRDKLGREEDGAARSSRRNLFRRRFGWGFGWGFGCDRGCLCRGGCSRCSGGRPARAPLCCTRRATY